MEPVVWDYIVLCLILSPVVAFLGFAVSIVHWVEKDRQQGNTVTFL